MPPHDRPGLPFGFLGAGGRLPKDRRGRFIGQFTIINNSETRPPTTSPKLSPPAGGNTPPERRRLASAAATTKHSRTQVRTPHAACHAAHGHTQAALAAAMVRA